ncbi:MAG: MBL fold metallo-hydrolase [Kofleriaceae bacterium]|nr:MBL fold metallo-hydrolase [Kofleriaceae bacterium]MCL4228058.1 MBL fold metallo-hydrolase [Myxococcales bacterium]
MPSGSSPGVTWLGHASAVVALGPRRVLVDPLGRARARAAGAVDAVLITHSHVDHLNRWTLKAVDRAAHLVVPRGAAPVVADLGFARVTEVEPGDHVDLGGLDVVAVPTRHDQGRWRKGDAPTCAGYVLTAEGRSVHHAGDVDFSDHAIFDELGKRFALDATLLPIGGMLPVWYYRWRRTALDRGVHIDPDCALDIFQRLGARALVPVHWGTVNLRLGPPSMPRRRLEQVARAQDVAGVRVLGHGETLDLAATPGVAAAPAPDAGDAREATPDRGAGGAPITSSSS